MKKLKKVVGVGFNKIFIDIEKAYGDKVKSSFRYAIDLYNTIASNIWYNKNTGETFYGSDYYVGSSIANMRDNDDVFDIIGTQEEGYVEQYILDDLDRIGWVLLAKTKKEYGDF